MTQQADHMAHMRTRLFEETSRTAFNSVGSWDEDMSAEDTDYDYRTVWYQLGCENYECMAPIEDEDGEEVRAAYDIINNLDEAPLNDYYETSIHDARPLVALVIKQAKEKAAMSQTVTCPRCNGEQGFAQFSHVPHKNHGGLCFLCDGEAVITVADAAAYNARKEARKEQRRANEQIKMDQRASKWETDHAAAYDRYADEYRLVYALARYDHAATSEAVFLINAYHANDTTRIQEARTRMPYMIENAGLDGLGLEEIEAAGTLAI